MKKALEIDSLCANMYYAIGYSEFHLKNYESAITNFNNYSDSRYNVLPGMTFYHIAKSYEELGEMDKADSYYKMALRVALQNEKEFLNENITIK